MVELAPQTSLDEFDPNAAQHLNESAPLWIHDLTVAYHRKPVLWDINLALPEAKLIAVVGPNGAGKTSLFNLLTGKYAPSEGQILFEGRDITGLFLNYLPADN